MVLGPAVSVEGRAVDCLNRACVTFALEGRPWKGNLLWQRLRWTKASWGTTLSCDTNRRCGHTRVTGGVPKQHSIWAPVGPQLGQVGPRLGPGWAQLGPIWECCLGIYLAHHTHRIGCSENGCNVWFGP